MTSERTKERSLARIANSGVAPGQKWRHYQTDAVYVVVAVGLFEPDLEPLVHYRIAGVPGNDYTFPVLWTRHLDVFCGQVAEDSRLIPRFIRAD